MDLKFQQRPAVGTFLNQSALLGPLADNGGPTLTHALLPSSPAIDAGSNALAVDEIGNPLVTDQRGEDRIGSDTVDIGAVEFESDRPFLLGDVNLNGVVNFLDISPFVSTLLDGVFLDQADINRDGVLSFLDISPFATLLASGGSAQSKQSAGISGKSAVGSGAVAKSGAVVKEAPTTSVGLDSASKPALNTSVVATVQAPVVTETSQGELDDIDGLIPLDTFIGPITNGQARYSFLGDRDSGLRGFESEGLVTRRSLALNAERQDLSLGFRETRSATNSSTLDSFSTAAELFDAHPETLDEIFDFQFEEPLAGLIK